MYINSKVRKPQFYILWGFIFFPLIYQAINIQTINIVFLGSIFFQVALLYGMYYFYIKYGQSIIKHRTLPTHIEFKKINLAFNFREPTFNYNVLKDRLLMFEVYLHNDYYKDTFQYKDSLNEQIRYLINATWKHVLLYFKIYKIFLAKVLIYCFFYGVLLLLVTILSYSMIEETVFKKIYIFFIFISFSFWLYITILILSSEAVIEDIKDDDKHEIYVIYNNANIFIDAPDLLEEIKRSNGVIGTYINISTSILYFSFLTILGSIL